jgi:hypothetical protein
MENIELKSEKTRNIIGNIPPVIIRFGNLFILIFILIILLLGLVIRVPKIQYGEIVVHSDGKPTELYLKQIRHKIKKGNPIKIYKNRVLLHQTIIPRSIETLRLNDGVFWTHLNLNLPQFSHEGISIYLEDNTKLSVEIETKRETLIDYLIFLK